MINIKHTPEIDFLDLFSQGKVRDTYCIPFQDEYLLQVATNRLSTHNVVHKSLIPFKAQVLTALTIFWTNEILKKEGIPHHIIAYGKTIYDCYLARDREWYPDDLHLRAVVVKELNMIPVEFIWRHYLTGSIFKNYYAKGKENPYGVVLPPGLKNMSFLKDLIFTPTDKSATDEPLDSLKTAVRYSEAFFLTKNVYELCRQFALARGVDIVDAKLECSSETIGDEIITPDSARFVLSKYIKVEKNPPFMDKEIFRQYAEEEWDGGEKVPLEFPKEIIDKGSQNYLFLFNTLTGMSLQEFQSKYMMGARKNVREWHNCL